MAFSCLPFHTFEAQKIRNDFIECFFRKTLELFFVLAKINCFAVSLRQTVALGLCFFNLPICMLVAIASFSFKQILRIDDDWASWLTSLNHRTSSAAFMNLVWLQIHVISRRNERRRIKMFSVRRMNVRKLAMKYLGHKLMVKKMASLLWQPTNQEKSNVCQGYGLKGRKLFPQKLKEIEGKLYQDDMPHLISLKCIMFS